VPTYDSAVASAAAEITVLQATVAARDTAISMVRAHRDTARVLLRQALAGVGCVAVIAL
jgi:hypothetical protein